MTLEKQKQQDTFIAGFEVKDSKHLRTSEAEAPCYLEQADVENPQVL